MLIQFPITASLVAAILILDTLGVNAGAGLAALGIGGIALALALKRELKIWSAACPLFLTSRSVLVISVE